LNSRTIPTGTHGRYLVEIPEHSRATIVGFHGYQENAAIHFEILRQIAHGRSIGLVGVQALNRFYDRANNVVASWMTKEDRELAIADNVAYVANVLSAVADESGITRPLAALPRVLLGRGTEDKWYTDEKAAADLTVLKAAGVSVTEHVFEGGHVWAPEFVSRAGQFLDELLSA
jgi:hypothetical protein